MEYEETLFVSIKDVVCRRAWNSDRRQQCGHRTRRPHCRLQLLPEFHPKTKVAEAEYGGVPARGPLVLVPLSEREDSGIDSDDAGRNLAAFDRRSVDSTDGSSSDDEPVLQPVRKKDIQGEEGDSLKMVSFRPDSLIGKWLGNASDDETGSENGDQHHHSNCIYADRSSPPLFEVELTASDDDDDASVLELVIPMQTSRYQRVPTSSPKKVMIERPTGLWRVLCCFRKF